MFAVHGFFTGPVPRGYAEMPRRSARALCAPSASLRRFLTACRQRSSSIQPPGPGAFMECLAITANSSTTRLCFFSRAAFSRTCSPAAALAWFDDFQNWGRTR